MGGWLIPWYYRDLSLRLMTKQNAITAKNPRAVLDKTPFMGGETNEAITLVNAIILIEMCAICSADTIGRRKVVFMVALYLKKI